MNTAMALPGAFCACALVFGGCSAQPDSSEMQGSAQHLSGETGHANGYERAHQPVDDPHPGCGGDDSGVSDDGGEDDGIPAEYRACQVDDDCVAVPLASCCRNGWKVAINRDEVEAYDDAFACHESRPICPMYIVNDTRVAECDRASLLCAMVPIDQIACGGFIAHPHACPDGYQCVYGRIPDVPGSCVAVSP